MSAGAPDGWVVVERFADVPCAHTYAARLQAEGVPAEVRADTPLLGELRPADVVVPSYLAHRARWVVAQWVVSEPELTRQALADVDADACIGASASASAGDEPA